MKEPSHIGIDVGGTKIRAALVSPQGVIKGRITHPTEASRAPQNIMADIHCAVEKVTRQGGLVPQEIGSVGIGIAGQIDLYRGVVIYSPNLFWREVRLREGLEGRIASPIYIDNDVKCAALGELYFGKGKGLRHFLCVFVGTGIGTGMILGGSLYRGHNNAAGEAGHTTFDSGGRRCRCGNRGCFEAYAGGVPMAEQCLLEIDGGSSSSILELTGGDREKINASLIYQAAKDGDPVAVRVWNKAREALGVLISNLVTIFNPQRIILGGGVIKGCPPLLKDIEREVAERSSIVSRQNVEIVVSNLMDDAAVLGASMLWKELGKQR